MLGTRKVVASTDCPCTLYLHGDRKQTFMGVVLEIRGFWIKHEGVADACWIRISGMLSAVMHVMDNPMDWVVILTMGGGG